MVEKPANEWLILFHWTFVESSIDYHIAAAADDDDWRGRI